MRPLGLLGQGWRTLWLVIAPGAGAAAAVASWVSLSPGAPHADPDDPRQVAVGRAVYREYCANCHGADLEGQPDWQIRGSDGRMPAPPHDASGHTWHHADDLLFGIVKHGLEPVVGLGYESDMPAFDDVLADDEIWAVLAFIKSSWPERERAYQEEVTRAARHAER